MEKKFMKWLVFLVVFSMLVLVLTACGDKNNIVDNADQSSKPVNDKETQTEDEEPLNDEFGKTLEEYSEEMELTPYFGIGTASPTDPINNPTIKYIKDKFRIDLSGSIFPSGEDVMQKLGMMVASGAMPDIINFGIAPETKEIASKFAAAGMILDAEPYINKYMPNMRIHYNDIILKNYRDLNDEKLYIIPSFSINPDNKNFEYTVESNMVMGVRKDLMKELGKNFPNTPDDFYDLLKSFKELPPVDGQEFIPYQPLLNLGDVQMHIGGMFGIWTHRKDVKDDEKRTTVMQEFPEYVEYLKYAAKLYREGLIDPEFMITPYQKVYERVAQGRVGVYGIWPNDIINNLSALRKNIPEGEIEPITIPRKSDLETTMYWQTPTFGWMGTIVSKKVKDPERVFKLMDWMTTQEGWATMCWGAPGEDDGYWYYNDNGEMVYNLDVIEEKTAEDPLYMGKARGGWVYFIVGILQYLPSQIADIGGENANPLRTLAAERNEVDTFIDQELEMIQSIPMGPIEKEKGTAVFKVFGDAEPKIIMEAKDDQQVETMYQEMMESSKDAGLYDVLKERYERIQQMQAGTLK